MRAVLLPKSSFAITASRDGTAKIWKEISSKPPHFDPTELSQGAQFKTCVAYQQPTKEYPDGLILSSGQDAIIEARQPDKTAETNADGLLLGHTNQVCSLDVNSKAGYFVSGSWDKTARIWNFGKWESEVELEGHSAAVWGVVAYDEDTVVTCCADRGIRVFDINGKLRNSFDAKDIVRALVKLPASHPGDIAAATNDGVIRIWTLKGELLAELHGHESFIYSLTVLPSGDIVSSGEDRTIRIWKGTDCVQIITLPAISVWSVSASPDGDIIVGSSDKLARIFTRNAARQAEPTAIAEFEESVRSSAIPKQQMSDVNTTDLPGPEFLQQKSGTKEGQKVLIKESNGTTTVHEWSMQGKEWVKIGELVDSTGSSSTKQSYLGQEYDYVFDVNIDDSRPNLKLPFNVTQNPYDAATKFLQDNELPTEYLEEVANFIVKSTQGASLGASEPRGPDPLGTENRYRPGEVQKSIYKPKTTSNTDLPLKGYLSLASGAGSIKAFQQVEKVNIEYKTSGQTDMLISDSDMQGLNSVAQVLSRYKFDGPPSLSSLPVTSNPLSALLKIATEWQPPAKRLAGFDLLRLLPAALHQFPPTLSGAIDNAVDPVKDILTEGTAFDRNFLRSNNKVAMMATRFFTNLLYGSTSSRSLVQTNLDAVLKAVETAGDFAAADHLLAIAICTFFLNLSVFIFKEGDKYPKSKDEWIMSATLELFKILTTLPASDNKSTATPLAQTSEPAYRAFMALGTLIIASDEEESTVQMMMREGALDFSDLQTRMEAAGWMAEPRFQKAMAEINGALAR